MSAWIVVDGYRDTDGLVEPAWIKELGADDGDFVMQFDTHLLPKRGVLRRIAAEHNACDGYNPGVMRELAKHCLRDDVESYRWSYKLGKILERLRT